MSALWLIADIQWPTPELLLGVDSDCCADKAVVRNALGTASRLAGVNGSS